MRILAFIAVLPFIAIYYALILGFWIVMSPVLLAWATILVIESVWDYAMKGVWLNPFRDIL